jgi:hypothetical protein
LSRHQSCQSLLHHLPQSQWQHLRLCLCRHPGQCQSLHPWCLRQLPCLFRHPCQCLPLCLCQRRRQWQCLHQWEGPPWA